MNCKISLLCMLLWPPVAGAAAADPATSNYPTRPVRFIVPQSPGGATDLVGRMVAAMLSERLGQSIVVDNRPGAATIVGTEIGAKADPDGYTLLMAPSSLAILPSMNKKLPFDPIKDFAPITTLSEYPNVVLLRLSLPVNSIKELIALAKAKPGSLNYASGGVGTGTHLGAELFDSMAGTKMVHVPYKGGGPANSALLGGQIDLQFTPMPTALPLVKLGKLKGLAVTSAKRSSLLPNLPTVAESGVPGYEQTTWNGLLAQARTPPAIVNKISTELIAALKMSSTRERFAANGLDPGGISPKEFSAMLKREIAKWGKLIRDLGIKPEE